MGDDMVEFRPQESPSEASKDSTSPLDTKRCRPRSVAVVAAPLVARARVTAKAVSSADETGDVPAHDLTDRAGKERIMGAAEQQGVDLRVNDWRQKSLREHTDLFESVSPRSTNSAKPGHAAHVSSTWGAAAAAARWSPTGHGASRADDARGGFPSPPNRSKPWFDNTNNRHAIRACNSSGATAIAVLQATTISLGSKRSTIQSVI